MGIYQEPTNGKSQRDPVKIRKGAQENFSDNQRAMEAARKLGKCSRKTEDDLLCKHSIKELKVTVPMWKR